MLMASCNLDLYTGNISSDNDTYIPPKKSVFDPTKKPSMAIATNAYYTDRINIVWEEVEGADYYSIERAKTTGKGIEPADDDWKTLPVSVYSNSYSDTRSLEDGVYYAYRISAHSDSVQDKSEPSDVCYGTKLSPVQYLSVEKGANTDSIKVSWTQMPGVKSYRIYASNDSDFSENEFVGEKRQIQDVSKNNENYFIYPVADYPDKPAGSTVYFCIQSVGEKDVSDFSPVQSGYSLIIGSPQMPVITYITKGDQTADEGITIKWNKDVSDIDGSMAYKILRSSAGTSESVIFNTADGDTLEKDGENGFIFKDKAKDQNTEYIYSIVASNSVGQSPEGKSSGYVLSSPYNLSVYTQEGVNKYYLNFTAPIGAEEEDHDKWRYQVTTVTEGNDETTNNYSLAELKDIIPEITAKTPTDAGYADEIRKISIVTTNEVNGSVISSKPLETSTVSISGIPNPVKNVKASQFQSSTFMANTNGVYPVMLTWEIVGDDVPAMYTVYRRAFKENNDYDKQKLADFKVKDDLVYYDNDGTEVGEKYVYAIEAKDLLGRSSGTAALVPSNEGWGLITGEVFIQSFQSNLLKPWEYPKEHPEYVSGSKDSIWGYISQAGLGSLGSTTVSGTRGGSISYNATGGLDGGTIRFTYTDGYSEAPYDFALDGDCGYTMKVSLSGSGSVSATSKFKTKGMYVAEVDFGNLSVSSQKFTGKYVVTFKCSDDNVTVEVKP